MLIHIKDKLYIKNDSDRSYMLCTKERAKEREYYKAISYHSSLNNCFVSFLKREQLLSDAASLKELISVTNETKKYIAQMMKEAGLE